MMGAPNGLAHTRMGRPTGNSTARLAGVTRVLRNLTMTITICKSARTLWACEITLVYCTLVARVCRNA